MLRNKLKYKIRTPLPLVPRRAASGSGDFGEPVVVERSNGIKKTLKNASDIPIIYPKIILYFAQAKLTTIIFETQAEFLS